jgi:cysteine desulfurase
MPRVYLDHHAATPLSPRARAAMASAAEDAWANASSAHAEGRAAKARLEAARRAIAAAVGCAAADVVLTGGGTEACNLGVLGFGAPAREAVERLVVVTSTLAPTGMEQAVAALGARGAEIHTLALHARPRDERPELVARPRPAGAAWMLALPAVCHETGTILDPVEIARALPECTVVVVDACQALGKLPSHRFSAPNWAVAISGAKIGASAGSGALVAPRRLELAPRLLGGSQERGRRAGTPDVAAHAGFAAACAGLDERLSSASRIGALRDQLERGLVALGAAVNGAETERVATVTNVSFAGWRKATLVAALDLEGIAVSAGAACSSGLDGPSPAILSLHPDEPWRAERCVRFSLGPETTERDIELTLAALDRVLARRPG